LGRRVQRGEEAIKGVVVSDLGWNWSVNSAELEFDIRDTEKYKYIP
jgi:hypothetical protein